MSDLQEEYIKAVSTNVVLNGLHPADRLHFYCLLIAKDYTGVYSFLKKKIPDLYEKIASAVNIKFFENTQEE